MAFGYCLSPRFAFIRSRRLLPDEFFAPGRMGVFFRTSILGRSGPEFPGLATSGFLGTTLARALAGGIGWSSKATIIDRHDDTSRRSRRARPRRAERRLRCIRTPRPSQTTHNDEPRPMQRLRRRPEEARRTPKGVPIRGGYQASTGDSFSEHSFQGLQPRLTSARSAP
jgi:hypothetical protein